MPYFVIGDDGQKYGPADIATLNQWIAENRLLPTQMLEDAESGVRMAASAVQGLVFPPTGPAPGQPYQQPQPGGPGAYSGYPRGGAVYGDDGSNDVRNAWICGVVGLCCCMPVAIGGIVLALRAKSKGNPAATGPLIFSIVAISLSIIGIIIRIALFASGSALGPRFPGR